MQIRLHLSSDLISKNWHLEAHDIQAQRWFVIAEAPWSIQLARLCQLGISQAEINRLAALKSSGKMSAWLEFIDMDASDLVEAGFILQPTLAAIPLHKIPS
jgi:hypothetical protein